MAKTSAELGAVNMPCPTTAPIKEKVNQSAQSVPFGDIMGMKLGELSADTSQKSRKQSANSSSHAATSVPSGSLNRFLCYLNRLQRWLRRFKVRKGVSYKR